jgi:maleate cis-trans isomerase
VASYGRSQKADALVMSCGRLNTLDLLAPLEGNIRVPVVSSTPHGLMNGVRLLKTVSPKAKGFGTVFEKA